MYLIIVEEKTDWRWPESPLAVVSAKEYIAWDASSKQSYKVINLCHHFAPLSLGYYCSLLAQARGDKIVPEVDAILRFDASENCAEIIQALLSSSADIDRKKIICYSYFGHTRAKQFKKLARMLYQQSGCPLLKIILWRDSQQQLFFQVHRYSLKELPRTENIIFIEALTQFIRAPWSKSKLTSPACYDLAILVDDEARDKPSNKKALQKFCREGRLLGLNVQLIGAKDYDRLLQYDALFIRQTTAIDNIAFRFAQQAKDNHMVVIDDPVSIFRCSNKVYLAELFKVHQVSTLKTIIFDQATLARVPAELPFPFIIKIPDGCFSKGVYKIKNTVDFEQMSKKLFEHSALLLAQEYLYTAFDWRIGILNKQPLFACKYYMSSTSWKIIRYNKTNLPLYGAYETISVDAVPPLVLSTAVQAAALVGDGLYGVDLKEHAGTVYVLEVNDNPNIDAGVEDKILKEVLYQKILKEFIRRLEARCKLD